MPLPFRSSIIIQLDAQNAWAEHKVYTNAVTAQGGVLSDVSTRASLRFLSQWKRYGQLQKSYFIGLLCGDFSALKAPAFDITGNYGMTLPNFLSADYAENVGLTTNGSKYINTACAASYGSVSSVSGLVYASNIGTGAAATISLMGASDASTTNVFQQRSRSGSAPGNFALANGTSAFTVSSSISAGDSGLWGMSSISTTDLRVFKNGAQAGGIQTGARSGSLTTKSIYVGAHNNNGTAAQFEAAATFKFFEYGAGRTPTEMNTAYQIIQEFENTLSRAN
jgi:hypothetical protein